MNARELFAGLAAGGTHVGRTADAAGEEGPSHAPSDATAEEALFQALGIPEAVHPLVMDGPEAALQCARYDLFATDDGRWMVSEFNDDVPGAFNEAVGIPGLIGDPGAGLHWEGDFRARFVEAFEPFASRCAAPASSARRWTRRSASIRANGRRASPTSAPGAATAPASR